MCKVSIISRMETKLFGDAGRMNPEASFSMVIGLVWRICVGRIIISAPSRLPPAQNVTERIRGTAPMRASTTATIAGNWARRRFDIPNILPSKDLLTFSMVVVFENSSPDTVNDPIDGMGYGLMG